MHMLHASLAGLLAGPADTVLHLGAGDSLRLVSTTGLDARRWLLVEGDARRAAALRESAARERVADRSVAVHECVVSAAGGPVSWNRHTLGALDGLVDMTPLAAIYPRLRLAQTQTVDSTAAAALVDQLVPSGEDGRHVLLLDLPGQEQPLLRALGLQRLERFAALVVCGCRQWPATAALAELQAAGWSLLPEGDGPPLWPVHRLRRRDDVIGTAQRPAERKGEANDPVVRALRADLAQAQQALADATDELQALRSRGAESGAWQADRARLTAAFEAARQELEDLREAQAREAAQWQRALQAERDRHDALRRQLADAEAQIGMLKDLLLRDDAA